MRFSRTVDLVLLMLAAGGLVVTGPSDVLSSPIFWEAGGIQGQFASSVGGDFPSIGAGSRQEGACCIIENGGECWEVMSEQECWPGPSNFHEGMSCEDNPCGEPGACCLEDGTCMDVLNDEACGWYSGISFHGSTSCSANPCGSPGACCFSDGSCSDVSNANQCTIMDGIEFNEGMNCSSGVCKEACCYSVGMGLQCIETHGLTCDQTYNGYPQGPGTTCAMGLCVSEDCNNNGIDDEREILVGSAEDCNLNSRPDECDVPPLGEGPDCNNNMVPDECELQSGGELYAVGYMMEYRSAHALYTVNPSNGALTWKADFEQDVEDVSALSAHPLTGELYVIVELMSEHLRKRPGDRDFNGPCLATVDRDTAVVNPIGELPQEEQIGSIAFRSDGTLYGVVENGFEIFSTGEIVVIDTGNASVTSTGIIATPCMHHALAFRPRTNLLYHATRCEGSCGLETINVDTGEGSLVGLLSEDVEALSPLAFHPSGHPFLGFVITVYDKSNRGFHSIDPSTGELSYLGPLNQDQHVTGMAFAVDSNDCNGNEVLDECDIIAGTSADCNSNGVPDECDVTGGTSEDCNTNGVPDECDIAGGTSPDCQPNGVPDECDMQLGGELYAAAMTGYNSGPALYSVDPSNGSMTLVADFDESVRTVYGLSAHPCTGALYIVVEREPEGSRNGESNTWLATVNPQTAALSLIGAFLWEDVLANIAFHSDGTLYGIYENWESDKFVPGEIVVIDTNNVSVTSTGIIASSGMFESLAFRPGTDLLYHSVLPVHYRAARLETINVATAEVTMIGELPEEGMDALYPIAFHPSGAPLLGFAPTPWKYFQGGFFSIDPSTIATTYLGPRPDMSVNGMVFTAGSLDCNDNGVPDECEIDAGTSEDCNNNGMPDECDLAGGGSKDCNTNGVPDECDISGATSTDCQPNGIPDECELDTIAMLYAVGDGDEYGESNEALHIVDPSDASLTRVGWMQWRVYSAEALAIHPSTGELYAVVEDRGEEGKSEGRDEYRNGYTHALATVNRTTGDVTIVGNLTGNEVVSDIAFRDNGVLYGVVDGGGSQPGEIVIVDTATAALTPTGVYGASGYGQAIAFHPTTGLLYHVAPWGEGDGLLETIDVDTGVVTSISTSLVEAPYDCLAFHPSGEPLLGHASGKLYSIDPETGQETYIGTSNMELRGMAFLVLDADCNNNGVPDECDITGETSADCNGNNVPDECDLAGGISEDCNTDGVPDECQLIDNDCNNDGVPDECQLADNDCNENSIPDDCDIAGSTSEDCQPNGIPDECDISGLGWLEGWERTRVVDITGSTSALTDYQVLVALDTASLIAAGEMRLDCGDLRFTDANGTSLLDYWIESGCNTDSTLVWVKVPSIPTGGATIYVYYGNPSASSASNGTNTFEFFDDFEGTVLDTDKWTESAGASHISQNDYLRFYGGGFGEWVESVNSYSGDLLVDADVEIPSDWSGLKCWVIANLLFYVDSSNYAYETRCSGCQSTSRLGVVYSDDTEYYSSYADTRVGTYHFRLTRLGGTITTYYEKGSGWQQDFQKTDVFTDDVKIRLRALSAVNNPTIDVRWDNLKVRKYASPEPETSMGAEGIDGSASEDCNSNDIPDECEVPPIGDGPDCNTDGVPDDCQLADNDCNENSIPDDCDIAAGTSEDCQPNGIPGECELGELGWLEGWQQTRVMDITGSTSALTDYQVLVMLDTASLIAAGEMRSDCGDLRFTEADGAGLLDYWIESDCNTDSTRVWVKVPSIPTEGTAVYMHYGNPSAVSASNGTNTLDFFDDFEGYAVGTESPNDWTNHRYSGDSLANYVTNSVSHGGDKSYYLYGHCSASARPVRNTLNSPQFDPSEQFSIWAQSCGQSYGCCGVSIIFITSSTAKSISYRFAVHYGTQSGLSAYYDPNSGTEQSNPFWRDAADVEIHLDNVTGSWTEVTRNIKQDYEDNWGSWDYVVKLIFVLSVGSNVDIGGGYGCAYYDDVRVLKYASPEPSVTVGAEGGTGPLSSNDCNDNQVPDECEVPPIGDGPDCNTDGVPDDCQLVGNDCNNDSVPDDCQLLDNDCNTDDVPDDCQLVDNDCNNDGMPDECQLAGNDCNTDGVPDDCQLAGNDCNNDGIPDECQLAGNDCNGNLVPDDCDIAAGTSEDCQPDDIPDDCQLGDGDCNSNGIPDDCDIAAGTSEDCQLNGIPDECDINLINWLLGWSHSKDVHITGSTSALTDYQVLVTVDTESLIAAGRMMPDCGDLRFTDANGTSLLDYWIKSGCDTDSTLVWVKVPSIPTVGTTIYMYYGNPSASSASNGTNTFKFFDDFDGGSSPWSITNPNNHIDEDRAVDERLGINALNCNEQAYVYKDGFSLNDFAVDWKFKPVSYTHAGWYGPYMGVFADHISSAPYPSGTRALAMSWLGYASEFTNGGWGTGYGKLKSSALDANHIYELTIARSGSIAEFSLFDCTNGTETDQSPISFTSLTDTFTMLAAVTAQCNGYPGDSSTGWIDDVRVRKYASPEPAASVEGESSHSSTNDCNNNMIPDECDVPPIGDGPDCNTDGIPDECQLGDGDCNSNGIPDDCDIAAGTSDDCQLNGIPDECDLDLVNWLPGWSHSKDVHITGSTSALTDYQVLVTLDTESLIAAGRMLPDCGDLRFTDANGTNLLDYWIESGCDTDSTLVWVKVPLIPTGGTTIYMYYGNPSESSMSNGTNTFEFFDDGEGETPGSSLSAGGWTNLAYDSYANDKAYSGTISLKLDAPGTSYGSATKNITKPDSWVTESMVYDLNLATTYDYARFGVADGASKSAQIGWEQNIGGNKYNYAIDGLKTTTSVTRSVGWHAFKIIYDGTNLSMYIDDTPIKSPALYTFQSDRICLTGQDNNGVWFDDIRVRKYASPEPGASIGEESSHSATNDCNNNMIPDECDVPPIGDGPDCNTDGIPDECQLVDNDCNSNGIPDDCDIAADTSEDCQLNGIPDECDINLVNWLLGWSHSKAVHITGSTSALTDYPVLVTLDTESLIAAGRMMPDCGDLRFTNANSTSLLDYWIESGCDTDSTLVWVKVPSIPTVGTTIYMYYANPSASPASDGEATFEFFDDFEGASIDTIKWDMSATNVTPSTDHAFHGSKSAMFTSTGLFQKSFTHGDFAFKYWAYFESAPHWVYAIFHGDSGNKVNVFWGYPTAGNIGYETSDNAKHDIGVAVALNDWKALEIRKVDFSADTYDIVYDDVVIKHALSMSPGTYNDAIYVGSLGATFYMDCFLIRKYASPEPAAGVGAERSHWDDNDCNGNLIPDECDVPPLGDGPDCNNDGVPDECQLTDNDCNGNLVPDECDVPPLGDGPDCNGNAIPDECDIAAGTSLDCQPDGVPDECQLADNDCNENSVPDDCDIAGSTSPDCNTDAIPDECQLSENDCNNNMIPDDCDIASGTSEDCQPNGVPDECDLGITTPPGPAFGWGMNNHGQATPPEGNDFVAIDAGWAHSLAVKVDGSIAGWGCNEYWQATPPSGNDFAAVAAGTTHSVALKTDGSLVAWGYNYSGSCNVPSGNDFVAIAAGENFGLALKEDGSIVGWGANANGESTPPAGNDFVAIDVGFHHSLALKDDGSIVAWGYNVGGQCDAPAGNDFVAIAGGADHSLALKADGSLVAWGCGHENSGQCDVPAGNDFVAIAANWLHSLALKSDGSIVAWGRNDEGQCNVPAGNGFVVIAAGGQHSLALTGNATGDCNENGIPDECDIAAGTSEDCQPNGRPDECDIGVVFDGLDALSDGLVAYWEMDGDWLDSTGNGHDGTPGGDPGFVPGMFGQAGWFDGAGDHVTFTDFPAMPEGTISFWFRPSHLGSGAGILSARAGYSTGDLIIYDGETSDKLIVLVWKDGGGWSALTSSTPILTGTWYHGVFTWDSIVGKKLYVDGAAEASDDDLTPVFGSAAALRFGVQDGRYYNGLIDQFALWDRALSTGEVSLLYNTASEDCNNNGIPDECDVPPIGDGPDCNNDGVPDECQLADNDCNNNDIPDECDVPPIGEEPDCNGNLTPDDCDIAAGTSADCQPDGIPDDCQLADNDCNGNSVPDECDIAGATSVDNNANNIPDECEAPPEIVTHSPGGIVYQPVNFVDVTFSEMMNGATFEPEDVLLTDPDGGVIAVDAPVNLGGNVWRIGFAQQSQVGLYEMIVGPDVVSVAGHAMTEAYTGQFCILLGEAGIVELLPHVTEANPTYVEHWPLQSVYVTFNRAIDADTFTVGDVQLVGPDGNVTIVSVSPVSETVLEVTWSPQTQDGDYLLRVGPSISDLCGVAMDAAFEVTIVLNAASPEIVSHTPQGPVHYVFDHLDVTFSEAVNSSSFTTDDVVLVGPLGEIPVASVSPQGGYVYRISFTGQTGNGDYMFTIGPDVTDTAGTPMASVYQPTVTVALPNLELTNCLGPDDADAGESIEVNWTVTNVGTLEATGSWLDKIYLSDDDAIGGDLELGSFLRYGPLADGDSYNRTQQGGPIPANYAGTYWVVVVTDATNTVSEPGAEDNNALVCGTVFVNDTAAPETIITSGPADGAVLNVTEVTFEWTGTDNSAPVEQLEYSSCFWAECDPGTGPFSSDTSYTFYSLGEGSVTIKVTTRDLADNIDPTPEVRSFTIDLTPPDVLEHAPTGDVYVPVAYVDVTFSEGINAATFSTGDIILTGPAGAIAVNSPVHQGANVWRIGFASQDTEGDYIITIGPDIEDPAGSGMDEAYVGDFTLLLPDLAVSSLTIPAAAQTEQTIEVSWTVTNSGDGSATGSWQDCVYLSEDDAIGGDTLLGCFARPSEPASGGHYDTAGMVTIPGLLPDGDYWIIVVADGNEELVESVEGVENNGLVSTSPIAIALAPRPDLQITGLTPPPDIPSGAMVEVVWTVTNMGNAPAVGPWNERISGSTDDTIGDDNAGSSEHRYAGVLAPGESIVRVDTYQAPGSIPPGGFWIVVCADSGSEVSEQDENNNCAIAEVCVDCQQPDLVLTSIVGPVEATWHIDVEWTVLNNGNGTAHGYWWDRVYLSADTEVGGDDILVGEFQKIGPLDVAESYTDNKPVAIPVDLEGPYYLIVVTDALNNVSEPGGEGNNSLVRVESVNISQPDLPDLIVSQLTAPTEVVTGETITVNWTVSNAGELAADGAWIDRVYLSNNDQYDAGDTAMVLFAPPSSLDVGQTYPGVGQFSLPGTPGDYWIIVYTDSNDNIEEGADDDNNTYTRPITVGMAPRPDLLMVEVIAAASGVAGSEVPVQWTVRNDGEIEAPGGWTDRVYISTDAVLGDDLQLAQFERVDPLGIFEEYTHQEQVTVPITFEGHYYFLVVTDVYNELGEGPDTAANERFTDQTTEIVQPDLPDLTVTTINAVTFEMTGEIIEVSWEVSNIGEWPAVGEWKDRLYISTDNQWDTSDLLLGWMLIDSPLADGSSYLAGGDYRLPAQAGTYWFIVITNADGDVEEGADLVNNTYVSPSTITLESPPRPDLQVLSVEPPATHVAGEPMEVTWTVTNTSIDIPAIGPWYERIYISPNAQIGGDSLVANIYYDGTIQPGETMEWTYELSTPYMPNGYYVVVCTDAGLHVAETNESNNCAITATASHIVLPDLAVSDVVAPADAYAGSIIPISWTVTNIGGASTAPFHWVDAVYMSHDGQSTLMGTRYYMLPLLPTNSCTGEVNVTLPDRIVGEYQFYVKTDVYNYVHEEGPAENNTAYAPNPTDIVQPDRPNLVVTDIVLSSNGVTWTVTNTSVVSANGFWCDRVVAVSESSGQEFVLGDYYRSTPVAAGDSYSWTEPIGLELDDPVLHGEYRIVVTTDYTDTVNEGLGSGEYDNTTTDDETFTVTAPDRPNLVVTDIVLSSNGVSWTVMNIGTASATGTWYDRVVAVSESDPGQQIVFGNYSRSGPLAVGGFYEQSTAMLEIDDPALHGEYRMVVTTDYNGRVNEGMTGAEDDNTTIDDETFMVIQPARPNLVVTDIVTPPGDLVGAPCVIRWTVTNTGDAPANGFWSDRIILVSEGTGHETILGYYAGSMSVAIGDSYERTVTSEYPHDAGEYRLKIITDYANTLNEGLTGGENDNTTLDDGTFLSTTYLVTVETDLEEAVGGTPVPLRGQALTLNPSEPLPNTPVLVGVKVRDTLRTLSATTDDKGDYETTFHPLPTEGGRYRLIAGPPSDLDPAQQDVFLLWGMKASPRYEQVLIYPGSPVAGQISLVNRGDVTLTGVDVSLESTPEWLDVQLELAGDTLLPLGSIPVYYTLSASGGGSGNVPVVMNFTNAQGATATGQLNVTVAVPYAALAANPTRLQATMVRSGQTLVGLEITNVGAATATDLHVFLPDTTWMHLGSTNLPDLEAGESATVLLELLPDKDMLLGEYGGSISVGDAQLTYGVAVPYRFDLVSQQLTNITVLVEDEATFYSTGQYSPDGPLVSGALVQLFDPETGDLVAEGTTGQSEAVEFHSLTEGFYDLRVRSDDHANYRETILVEEDGENEFDAFIPRETVTYTWTVEEVEWEDITIITLEAVFETVVPMPVITVEPPLVDLTQYTEDVFQIDFTIRNHGLITADDVRLSFGDHPNWTITPLVEDLGDLEAMGERVVPVMYERVSRWDQCWPCQAVGRLEWKLVCKEDGQWHEEQIYVIACVCGGPGPGGGGGGGGGGGSDLPNWYSGGWYDSSGDSGPGSGSSGGGGGDSGGSGWPGWLSGPGWGSPGQPYSTQPSWSPEEDCRECDPDDYEPDTYLNVNVSSVFTPFEVAAEAYILGQTGGWISADVEVTAEGGIETCCDANGNVQMETYADAGGSIELSLNNTSFEYDYSQSFTALEVDMGGTNGHKLVSFDVSASFVAGLVVTGGGSVSGRVDSGGCGDPSVDFSGSLWASGFLGMESTGSGVLTVVGHESGSVSYTVSAGFHSGANVGFHLDESGTLVGQSCFEGAYVMVDVSATLNIPGFASKTITVVPCTDHFFIAPIGNCGDLGCPGGGRDNYLPSPDIEPYRRDFNRAAREVHQRLHDSLPKYGYRYTMREANTRDESDGICAKVRLQIEQQAVITRTGFAPKLVIENPDDLLEVEQVFVGLNFTDVDGNPVNNLFAVGDAELSGGLTAVDGSGVLDPNGLGQATWLVIPRTEAAPIEQTDYFVSGVFSYIQGAESATHQLEPVLITVKPDPSLIVKYFWQRDVFSDDPFTPEIEPAEPFSLGLSMTNQGYGEACNVRVASGQPKIIENERGLLIAFELIGTEVGIESFTPALNITLGDIGPSETVVARWLMTSTLQGQFTEYSVEYEHINPLGDPTLSAIDSVEIFELIHVVRAEDPVDDLLMDFMTNQIEHPDDPHEDPDDPDRKDLPDTVHLSNGQVEMVTPVLDAASTPLSETAEEGIYESHLTAYMPSGWAYIKAPDPSNGTHPLLRVERSDGSELVTEFSAWQTDRTFREGDELPFRQHRIHLFDRGGNGWYTLIYGARNDNCTVGPSDEDCNTNGIADRCELEDNDCNSNGIPDDCDITAGTSEDYNTNGVPDECEPAFGELLLSTGVEPDALCVGTSDPVSVILEVANLAYPINGVQALVHYDPVHLSLASITPATGWQLIIPAWDSPDPDGDGNLTCALYLPAGEMSADGAIATLQFNTLTEGATEVVFQGDSAPFYTKLSRAADSSTILPDKYDSGTISIDDTVATASSNSPVCEGGTIELSGDPSTGPNEPHTYSWTGPDSFSSTEQNPTITAATLAMAGTYHLTVINSNGCEFTAQTDVDVQLCLVVNVEIEGLIGNGGTYGVTTEWPGGAHVDREVTFVLTDCNSNADTRVFPVTFTADTGNNKGVGSVTFTGLDAGLDWLSVQEGHTLRKLTAVDLDAALADSVTVFLPSGDFHTVLVEQDNLVDITDFSILASSWETMIDADESTGGDATGNGYHNAGDFALIQPNFLMFGEELDGCRHVGRVPPAASEDGVVSRALRTSIDVSELCLRVPDAQHADLDGNGVVDARDIRAFAKRHNLSLQPAFDARLAELEEALAPSFESAAEPVLETTPHRER